MKGAIAPAALNPIRFNPLHKVLASTTAPPNVTVAQ
jgi:hypothetical protein